MYCCIVCGYYSFIFNFMSKYVGVYKGSFFFDFIIEQIFMYIIYFKEVEKNLDS